MTPVETELEAFVVDTTKVDWERWCSSSSACEPADEPRTWFLPLRRELCQAQSRLLQLPTELICIIADNIHKQDLSQFARVSRACRHLARCRQFESAHILRRSQTRHDDLLTRLYQEATSSVHRAADIEHFRRLNVGPYIRTLHHQTLLDSKELKITYPIPRSEFIVRQASRKNFLALDYALTLKELSTAIELALPNLKALIMVDPIEMPVGVTTAFKQRSWSVRAQG